MHCYNSFALHAHLLFQRWQLPVHVIVFPDNEPALLFVQVVLPRCIPAPDEHLSTHSSTVLAAEPLDVQLLYDQAIMQFEVWIMQQLQQQLTPATAVPAAVDACMTVLKSVAGKAAAWAVTGVDVTAVEAACTAARQHIDTAVLQRQVQAADAVALPPDATAAAGYWRLPTGILPPELPATADAQGLQAALARQAANLGSLDVLPSGLSLPRLLQHQLEMLQACTTGTDVAVQHSLRTTERVLLGAAAAGFVQPVLIEWQVDLLADVVDSYRVVITAFKQGLDSEQLAMLQAELRSRGVLVGWVAYCLTHQAARAAHQLVSQFGVALDWEDLRHLTLTDKAATDAALGVASYLQQHSKAGRELFHLSQQEPSLSFADQYAAADSDMRGLLSVHRAAADARMDAHYRVVQRQQAEARQLGTRLADLDSKHSKLLMKRDQHAKVKCISRSGQSGVLPGSRYTVHKVAAGSCREASRASHPATTSPASPSKAVAVLPAHASSAAAPGSSQLPCAAAAAAPAHE
jgi:hypothetical protein